MSAYREQSVATHLDEIAFGQGRLLMPSKFWLPPGHSQGLIQMRRISELVIERIHKSGAPRTQAKQVRAKDSHASRPTCIDDTTTSSFERAGSTLNRSSCRQWRWKYREPVDAYIRRAQPNERYAARELIGRRHRPQCALLAKALPALSRCRRTKADRSWHLHLTRTR